MENFAKNPQIFRSVKSDDIPAIKKTRITDPGKLKSKAITKFVREATGFHTYYIPPRKHKGTPQSKFVPSVQMYLQECNIHEKPTTYGHRKSSSSRIFYAPTMALHLRHDERYTSSLKRAGLSADTLQSLLKSPSIIHAEGLKGNSLVEITDCRDTYATLSKPATAQSARPTSSQIPGHELKPVMLTPYKVLNCS